MSWWSPPTQSVNATCKVVIIGSGAGGAFAAFTLAEAGIDVIVLEKGFHYSVSNMPKSLAESVATMYEEGGFRTSDGTPPFPVAGGVGLGGSTLVNSAICFQTPQSTLAHWNELTNNVFANTEEFYNLQTQVERVMHVVDTYDDLLSGNDKAHKRAAIKLGWKEGNIRRNTPGCVGCGRCNAGCPIAGKNSVDRDLLPRAARAGARIFSGADVQKVTEKQATGIIRNRQGKIVGDLTISADIIIMSCGSIATPQLLLESGFGERNQHIGTGLHIHPVMNTWALLSKPSYARGATQGHFVDQFASDRILLESNPVIPGAFFQAFPVYGAEASRLMSKGNHMVSSGALVRDISEGTVYARSNGISKIRYNITEQDRPRLIKALRKGAELWFHGADAEMVALNAFGTKICRSMDDVYQELPDDFPAERLSPYCSHPQASCRMNRACDNNGLLRGSKSIYVMDASVLPSNVGRNPQISVMTVIRMLAADLATSLGGKVKPMIAS